MRSALLLIAAALSAFAQQEEVPTFRTEVTVVRLDVKVTDAQGRMVGDLSKDDFVIYDEDQRQPVLDFEREAEALRLVLLLDVSNSMWTSLRDLSRVTEEGLSKLRSGAEVALMLFALRNETAQPFTGDFALVEKTMGNSIFKQTLGSGTVLNDAIVSAARYLQTQPQKARRAILVVTDNETHRLKVSDNDAVRALEEAQALLSAIIVRPPAADARQRAYYVNPVPSGPDVNAYAKKTGGDVVATSEAGKAFESLIRNIRTRYGLQYTPPSGAEPNKYRHIRVELGPAARARYPGAVVETRGGYYTSR
jgi:VWFA-related protein